MAGNIKNTAASVHQRLLHKAKESYRPFNELLQRFAIERPSSTGSSRVRTRTGSYSREP